MKWVSHIAIGGALAAVIDPILVPIAVVGATAPDWMEWVLKGVGKPVKHRTVTHYLVAWVAFVLFSLFVWDWHNILLAFSIGGLSHILCDSFTVMGVPFGWWSDRRFHLFGGRLRTGQPGEYLLTGGIVLACMFISWQTNAWTESFSHFFITGASCTTRA